MGFLTDAKRWFVNELGKEPQGGTASWVILGLGVLFVLLGLLGLFVEDVGIDRKNVLIGVVFVCSGAAEGVPPSRVQTAKALRTLAWIGVTMFVGWIVIPPFLAASSEMKLIVAGALPVAFASVLLLYNVLDD